MKRTLHENISLAENEPTIFQQLPYEVHESRDFSIPESRSSISKKKKNKLACTVSMKATIRQMKIQKFKGDAFLRFT